MSRYTDFFFSDPSSVIQYETITVSHQNFSREYAMVRNKADGLTATIEGGGSVTFDYVPMTIEPLGMTTDLDFGIKITLGDLGEILPRELDNINTADGFNVYPIVTYRTFASDTLTAPMQGPFKLELKRMAFNKQGCVFECRPRTVNATRTGMIYTEENFPSLRGFK